MTSILLTNAPCSLRERYGSLAAAGSTLPQLGLASLAAVLRQKGHRAAIADCGATGLSLQGLTALAGRLSPDILGISAVTFTIARAAEAASALKKKLPKVKIVLGGPHATALPEESLTKYPCFDFIVRGEGEQSLVELAEAIAAGRPPASVPGIAYRDKDRVLLTPERPPIADLDSLPFPAWDLLPGFPQGFRPALFRYRRLPATHAVSSRGCPHSCVFCDCAVFGRKVRAHSAPYMADYAEELAGRYGVREIAFEDDQFLFSPSRVEDFCRLAIEKKLRLLFSANCRADSINDPGLLSLMRRAGFRQISMGVESGDPEVLARSGKRLTLSSVTRAVELLQRARIEARGFFVLGLPGETKKSLEKTRRFIRRTPFSDVNVFLCAPFPGSALYAELPPKERPEFAAMTTVAPAYLPEGLGPEELERARKRMLHGFYFRPRTAAGHLLRLAASPGALARAARAAAGL